MILSYITQVVLGLKTICFVASHVIKVIRVFYHKSSFCVRHCFYYERLVLSI